MTPYNTPVTIFSAPKAFAGSIAVSQLNAIRSWQKLLPTSKTILLGDDPGVFEHARELGAVHVPSIERNEFGTPLLNSIFAMAEKESDTDLMIYVNADIILTSSFVSSIQSIREQKFLMVGQRIDCSIDEEIDFTDLNWEEKIVKHALKQGKPHGPTGLDYFAYPKGLFSDMPTFAIGRTAWDNWLLYKAYSMGAILIDASPSALILHQDHDYNHHPSGYQGVWYGPEAQRNQVLTGGPEHLFDLDHADYELLEEALVRPSCSRQRSYTMVQKMVMRHPELDTIFIRAIYRCLSASYASSYFYKNPAQLEKFISHYAKLSRSWPMLNWAAIKILATLDQAIHVLRPPRQNN
jgi:hypothetical protein